MEEKTKHLTKQKNNIEADINIEYNKNQVNQAINSICDYIITNDTVNVRKFIDEYVIEAIIDKENDLITIKIA